VAIILDLTPPQVPFADIDSEAGMFPQASKITPRTVIGMNAKRKANLARPMYIGSVVWL
jgi:hypothetical protein